MAIVVKNNPPNCTVLLRAAFDAAGDDSDHARQSESPWQAYLDFLRLRGRGGDADQLAYPDSRGAAFFAPARTIPHRRGGFRNARAASRVAGFLRAAGAAKGAGLFP
eukprot:gene4720-20805_t